MDFIDLRTAVIEHVGRPDIVDVFPRLVRLAEAMLNRRVRTRDMVTSQGLTFTSGVADLPVDFLEPIGLFDTAGREYIQQPLQGARMNGASYALNDTSLTIAGHSGALTLQYYAAIPTINGSATSTNWLLTKYPSVYIYSVGLEAAKYLRDVDLAQTTKAILDMELADLDADDFRARYSRARVRVQGVTP